MILSFICTACSVEYNVVINNYSYSEDIYMKDSFKDFYDEQNWTAEKLINYHKYLIDVEMDEPYQLEYYELSPYLDLYNSGAHLFYKNRSFDDFILPFYKCYDNYIVERDSENEIITLRTEGKFLCPEYLNLTDSIILNIYSDFELIETNANDYENGKYTWDITNNEDKNIYLKLNTNNDNMIEEKKNPINWNFVGLNVMILVAIIFVIMAIMAIIRRRENKI